MARATSAEVARGAKRAQAGQSPIARRVHGVRMSGRGSHRFRDFPPQQVFGTARPREAPRSPHPAVRLAATMLRHLARRPAAMRSLPAMRALCTPKDAPPPAEPAETVNFFFIEDGEEIPATAAVGTSLLEAAHENDVDLEGAARHTPCRIDRASHRRARETRVACRRQRPRRRCAARTRGADAARCSSRVESATLGEPKGQG